MTGGISNDSNYNFPMNQIPTNVYAFRAVDELLCSSGQPTTKQLQEIADAGFKVVINLAMHNDPRYSLPDEAGTVKSLGMTYVHIPVEFATPSHKDLTAFFVAMQAHGGEKIWVHCAANMRVTAFLGLYRVLIDGWDRERSFALMNDVWKPNEVWTTFIESNLALGIKLDGAL